jgi:hypothetical protein
MGDFFFGKKPLGYVPSVYSNSENAAVRCSAGTQSLTGTDLNSASNCAMRGLWATMLRPKM